MSKDALKYPFPVDLLNSIIFPLDKKADVLDDAHNDNRIQNAPSSDAIKDKVDSGEDHLNLEGGMQELGGDGKGDFGKNLEDFLTRKKEDGGHEEKKDKAEQLGLVDPEQPKQ